MKFFEAHEYQPTVIAVYEKLKERLQSILPLAQVEHVGSSAVVGAISKGDLDIFVGVSKAQFEQSIMKIQSLGFQIKKDTLQTAALRMLESEDYPVDVAIQLVELGSEFESFLKFRDLLVSDPELLTQYNRLKKESEGLEPQAYREKKSKFIVKALRRS